MRSRLGCPSPGKLPAKGSYFLIPGYFTWNRKPPNSGEITNPCCSKPLHYGVVSYTANERTPFPPPYLLFTTNDYSVTHRGQCPLADGMWSVLMPSWLGMTDYLRQKAVMWLPSFSEHLSARNILGSKDPGINQTQSMLSENHVLGRAGTLSTRHRGMGSIRSFIQYLLSAHYPH